MHQKSGDSLLNREGWNVWFHVTRCIVLFITCGREVASLGFASVSFWCRDQVVIDFFPII